MTRYFLRRIEIEGFRGINNEGAPLTILFRKDSVNSVHAPNGVGKSSIYEALSYAITGKIPKLESMHQNEHPEHYVNNRFHSGRTATIDMELEPDDGSIMVIIRVRRTASGQRLVSSPSGYPDPEALLQQLNGDFTLMDYQRLMKFIEDTPLNRGRSFASLLGLSEYSEMRQALKSVADTRVINNDFSIGTLRSELTRETADATRWREKVQEAFALCSTGISDADIDSYATTVFLKLQEYPVLKATLNAGFLEKVDFDAVRDAIRAAEGGGKRDEYLREKGRVAELLTLTQADPKIIVEWQRQLISLIEERETLLQRTRGELTRQLFEAAQQVVASEEWAHEDICPLCDGKVSRSIAEIVEEQLSNYRESSDIGLRISEVWSVLAQQIRKFEQSSVLRVEDHDRKLDTIEQRFHNSVPSMGDVEETVAWLRTLGDARNRMLSDAQSLTEGMERDLPASLVEVTSITEAARQLKEAVAEYVKCQRRREGIERRIEVRRRWSEFIGKVTEEYAAAETQLAREVMTELETDYRAIFDQIMGESEVVPTLRRQPGREELHVELSAFYGQNDVSARALLSESYRNSLALAVFLSAARKHEGVAKFIVLDDVTSSFDAGNQWQLMEVIRRTLQYNPMNDGLQFIILSHDGLLERYFDSAGNTGGWYPQRLKGVPPRRPVFSEVQASDRLRSVAVGYLDNGMVQEAEPYIRQYLEFVLMQIITKVRIPVPLDFAMREKNRMVKNCLDAIKNAIDLERRAGSLVIDSSQVKQMEQTHVPILVGNWVSHYETASSISLAPTALKAVIAAVDGITDCFKYDDASMGTTRRVWYRSLSVR